MNIILTKIFTVIFMFSTLLNNFTFDSYIIRDTVIDDVSTENVDLGITSKSAILMEASTGKIIYEKNSKEELKPASVTKIMTVLLCYEKIKEGKLHYDDIITISSHAASMGGSQCFFEAGEEQKVFDILKCIMISSGNDAAVAMGEHISGSEAEFVKLMNQKAKDLGMNNTNFVNACGLDASNHYTSALDIALMSRELIVKNPEIFDISTIWMDHIVHKTAKGESRFDLANTNKFLKQYTGANGLKTGFTSEAGYCISATATRDGVTLIAVIMGAETKDIRNEEVAKLLDYGFSKIQIFSDDSVIDESWIFNIDNGVSQTIEPQSIANHNIVLVDDEIDKIEKKIVYMDLDAPIKKGETIASVQYCIEGKIIDEISILASDDVEKKSYYNSFRDLCNALFVIK